MRRHAPRESCGLSYNYHPHLFDVSDTGLEAREREWCVDGCGDGAIRGEGGGERHAQQHGEQVLEGWERLEVLLRWGA